MSKKWELNIVVPQPDNATVIAHMVMADKRPWCLLIPTDLIHYISQNVGGGFDKLLLQKVEAAEKIALSAAGCTWLKSRRIGVGKDSIFLGEAAT
jgi:hypothetical protein